MKPHFAFFSLIITAATVHSQAPPSARVPDGVKAHRDLAYVENGHPRQKLDLYVPEKAGAPLPLIIWVHGGGWAAGSKDGCPPLRQGFIERGYALASIGYRLSGDANFPAQIEDCKTAIRWLRAHARQYGLNPDRFGVWGSSAGGHLVALLGTSGGVKAFDVGAHLDLSSRVQAACDYYGPTDLLQMDAHALPEARLKHDPATSPESRLIGGAIQENKEKTGRANPIAYVSKDAPPFLIVHGDKDPVVPIHQSQLLFEALKKAGVSVHFHTIKGAGHSQGFGGREIDEMVGSFFDRCLNGAAAPAAGAVQTESEASATPQSGAGAASRGPRISWEQVRAREGVADDGRVPREKFKGPPPLFDRLDRNRDGVLTKADFEATPPSPPTPSDGIRPAPASPAPKPDGGTPEQFKLDGESWTCQLGGQPLAGILVKPSGNGPFPAILISHGLGSNARQFGLGKAREFVKWGFVCIATDYTHARADREGDRSQFGASAENIRRARACLAVLRSLPYVDARKIAAYGNSMGAFLTVGLAADAPGELAAAAITAGGIAPMDGQPAPSTARAAGVRAPMLILHGGADNTVPAERSASLKQVLDQRKSPNERRVFEGVGHNLHNEKADEVYAAMRDWFRRHGVLKP